jgi:hypothetical protein
VFAVAIAATFAAGLMGCSNAGSSRNSPGTEAPGTEVNHNDAADETPRQGDETELEDTRFVDDNERRLLYPPRDIEVLTERMSGVGPFYRAGDVDHGGAYSPNDGEVSEMLAKSFLSDPEAAYWVQPDLPFSNGDPWPEGDVYLGPMHAAWVHMTTPDFSDRDRIETEIRQLLVRHATHPAHDFADGEKYPIDYENYAPSPIFGHAPWMSRLIKARDMLGRSFLTADENEAVDQWFYDYSNWAFNWLHHGQYAKRLPNRESRDYAVIESSAGQGRHSYDGGPAIGALAMDYTNRHAYVASAASLAANYLAFHEFAPSTSEGPDYGQRSIDELLDHSRLFVEETIQFAVYPEGLQGDFERGDMDFYPADNPNVFPQRGWMYSMDVLVNLLDIAAYHAARGDLSVWDFGTTEGFDGTAGQPVDRNFPQKTLHYLTVSLLQYLNDAWGRTNFGEPLALPDHYHGVIHAAIASRFAPEDQLLKDAWRRAGSDFPPYPANPQPQGLYHAHRGGYGRYIGVIEHADLSTFGN